MLNDNYRLINLWELKRVVGRQSVYLGYYQNHVVDFIGEHLESDMGMLYVFPEYIHRGFEADLQSYLVSKTIENRYIPFDQVKKDTH